MNQLSVLLTFLICTCSARGLDSSAAALRGLQDVTATATEELPFSFEVVPLDLTGKPIPYSWGFQTLTTLGEDAARYEEQLSALLLSPISEWEVFERPEYTAGVRPSMTDGQADAVGLLEAEYKTPGGRNFFDWLVSAAGFDLFDPFTEGNDMAFSTPVRAEGPSGSEVYANAQITQFGATEEQPAIFVTAFHAQPCGPNELQFYTYPAVVPFEFRTASVQAITGEAPEISAVYSFRIEQIDADTIHMTSVAWIYFPPPTPLSQEIKASSALTFLAGVHDRIQEHLAVTVYAPATGEECPSDDTGMYGMHSGMHGTYGS